MFACFLMAFKTVFKIEKKTTPKRELDCRVS